MFQIDAMSRKPVYEQIVEQLEKFVLKGILTADSQLPSVRSLSSTLSINPNTIQKAYSELDRKGIIYSVPGRGCFVTAEAKEILSSYKREELEDFITLMKGLALAGITKEQILKCVNEVYDNKEVKQNDPN